jgi:hypothetical protein
MSEQHSDKPCEGPLAGLLNAVSHLESEQDGGWSPAAQSHLRRIRAFAQMLLSPSATGDTDWKAEAERYRKGMENWKATAEAKDADYARGRSDGFDAGLLKASQALKDEADKCQP